MPALATLTLVWLGAQRPEGRARAALDAWAESKGATLVEPAATALQDAEKTSALSARCDQALEQARDQISAGDGEAARKALRQLEQTLRDHPELLQAAWLMAERYRLEGQAIGPSSPDDAAAWERKADDLEGARAAAFGGRRATKSPREQVTVKLAVRGARRYEVFWDGGAATDPVTAAPGEHHLVVQRGGRVAWSGWVSVLASGTLDVWVPDAEPCTAEDLAGVSVGPTGESVVPAGIRCPSWAVAAPGSARGTVQIALCSGDRCQAPTTAIYESFATSSGQELPRKSSLPGWALWTIAGASVAATTALVLWGTGAFDRPEAAKKVVLDPGNL